MNPALAALALAPGLAVGSFLNVLAVRVPLRRSLVRPGSACMSCSKPIAWHDNIPLVSYLLLRGRCRHCAARIGLVYPAVELASALLVAGCVLAFGLSLRAAIAAFFCCVLVAISAVDIAHRIVPDRIVLPAIVLVLAAQTLREPSLAWPLCALGAALVADVIEATGILPSDKLAFVRDKARSGSFAQALIDEGLAAGATIARAVASQYNLPVVDIVEAGVAPEAAELIPLHVLERVCAIPYALDGDKLMIAVANPKNVHAIDELRLATRYQLELAVATREDIEGEIRRLSRAAEAFGARAILEEDGDDFEDQEQEEDDLEADDGISEAPLVRLVNSLIFQAAEDGASDMHFEPNKDGIVVRFRIDGVLHEIQRVPKRMVAGVTTRLKVLAKLDIAERRKPQDGRISLNARTAGRMLDIRVATLPTVDGEKLSMRLLDKSKKAPTLEELGLPDDMRQRLSEIIRRPTGALLVTGPTGSGKSTSLYAALSEINRPEINIVTIEDPVEYRLEGVSQMQINTRAGLTFASALRSILRADPDVVMVGEIRDAETAKISIEAALTGHLVLSTMHTNDAP